MFILEEHRIDKIDFLDIDIEGFDEKVGMSFDWKKYSPKCILIELLRAGEIHRFWTGVGKGIKG